MADDIAVNRARATRLVLELAVPVFVVVLLVAVLAAGILIGVLAAVVVTVVAVAFVWRSADGAVRGAIGGVRADETGHARLVNLVDGLGAANGVPPPALLVIDDPAPNALSFGMDPRTATIAVTSGLLERLGRVELEGVVAREIARIKTQETRPATIAVAVLRLVGPIGPWAARVRRLAMADGALVLADAEGVRLTRYPPGLADALERLGQDAGRVRAGSAATAHLWIEPPVPSSDVHPPLEERVEALREL